MKLFFQYLQLVVAALLSDDTLGQMIRPRRSLAAEQSTAGRKLANPWKKGSKKKISKKKSPKSSKKDQPTKIKHLPTKEMTGFDPEFVQLLATITDDLYSEPLNEQSFDLSGYKTSTAEVILFEGNGIFEVSNSPFVVVVVEQTMILAWRGTKTMADWIRDFAFAPSSSSRWSKVAKVVKVSAGDLSLIETCLGENEEFLMKEIENRNINQIVTTGHSLGGMLAFAAHLWLVGSWTDELNGGITNAKWGDLQAKQGLSIRTMAFEAGMNVMYYESDDANINKQAMDFLKNVGSTTVNTAFGVDIVPRAPGFLPYIEQVVINWMDEVGKGDWWDFTTVNVAVAMLLEFWFVDWGIRWELLTYYKPILEKFQHMGTIIYYSDADAEPKVYIDPREKGVNYNTNEGTSFPKFHEIQYKSYYKDDIADYLTNEHNFIVKGPGMSFPKN